MTAAQELSGRVAIVTGGAAGIGAAIAAAFRDAGARVAVFDTDPAPDGAAVDVGDLAAVGAAVAEVAARLGPPTVLVNNAAARSPRGRVTEIDPADWDRALRINLTGAFNLCRATIPHMIAAGGGSIVNVASQLGSVGVAGAAPYCASKGGLLQLTRVLALDHAADGIRVNALSPGAVMTDRLRTVFGSAGAAGAALVPDHPIGRLGRPEEIAEAALFLAGDRSGFMTGADMVVDGGYLAR